MLRKTKNIHKTTKHKLEIKELGEFGLIDHLTKDIKPQNPSTVKGVGEDCAVMQYENGRQVLVTTDMLMEGVHFDLQYTPMKHLGYKSAMVNLSDVYAMNGTPRQMVVSIALGKRFGVEDLEDFYDGLKMACDAHHVDIVGGDTTSSRTGLAISITCIGEANPEDVVMRNGAKETDLICVSGNLGAAYMGLQLLEREKAIFNEQYKEAQQKEGNKGVDDTIAQPDFSGREYLLERILKPEARRDIVEALASAGIKPTSMMDISDGLSSELMHICKQSGVGCRIYEDRIPVDYQTASAAEEFGLSTTTCALNGGEDYELLFTVPLTMNDVVSNIEDVKVIGYITPASEGQKLICRDKSEFDLKAQGWNPLKD